MKEQYKPIEKLTSPIQASYARGRNIFMPEPGREPGQSPPQQPRQGGPGVSPEAPISPGLREALANLQASGREPNQPVPERVQEAIENAWKKYYQKQGVNPANLSEAERIGLQKIIQAGSPPPISGEQEVQVPPGLPDDSPIKLELEALNTWLHAYGDFDLAALQKALENVTKADGTAYPELKRQTIANITSTIQSLRQEQRRTEDLQRERMDKRELREETTGWYKERLITPQELQSMSEVLDQVIATSTEADTMDKLLDRLAPVDKLFNRMFDRADANPHADFEHAMGTAGSQEFMHFTTALNQLREAAAGDNRKSDLVKKLIERYSAEHKLRELLHNAYFIAETGGEAKQFANYTTQFQSEFADLAFLGAAEVEVAFRIREQVLYQIKRENNGTIPYEKVAFIAEKGWSEWEKRTEEILKEANEKKMFGETPLGKWKIDRALSISRGMGMVLLRFPEIVAECPLRAPVKSNEAQPSIPWETISWELNPLDHKVKRYEIARELGNGLLYVTAERKKPWWRPWNQDEIARGVKFNEIGAVASFDQEERMADIRNLTKIGGWATHSSWRSFASALEEDQGKLRPLLDKNPGMAMRLVWNAYQIGGKAEAKKRWMEEYKRQNPEASDAEFASAWSEKEKELDAQGPGKKAEEADIETWKGAAIRIPGVILRVITDPTNKLLSASQRNEILRGIFGSSEGEEFQKLYTETETDLTFIKENLMKRRRDRSETFMRQGADGTVPKEDRDELVDTDFDVITNNDRRIRAEKLRDKVVEIMNSDKGLQKKILAKIKNRSFPFAITNEDVPFSEYRFAQTGGRGLITRRNNDWFQEVQANNGMIEMLKTINRYKSPEQIVETLEKIYDFSEVHDRDRAEDFIGFLARGIIRMYEKDGIYKLPFIGEIMGIGNLLQHRGKRGQSYAQTLYGMSAMAWDSDDIYNFTAHLRQKILTGKKGRTIVDDIRKETGGTLGHALIPRTKVAMYLFFLFFTYGMAEKIVKEKW